MQRQQAEAAQREQQAQQAKAEAPAPAPEAAPEPAPEPSPAPAPEAASAPPPAATSAPAPAATKAVEEKESSSPFAALVSLAAMLHSSTAACSLLHSHRGYTSFSMASDDLRLLPQPVCMSVES